MHGHPRIEVNPEVLGGKPVIRGTRISVELVLGLLAGGMTFDEILAEYPHLKRADLEAVVRYAAGVVAGTREAEFGVV